MDLVNGEIIKRHFNNDSYYYFTKCQLLAGTLDKNEFHQMVSSADKQNIWCFKGLTTMHIPYILLACHGLFLKSEIIKTRTSEFYFVLDPNMEYLDDLWNLPGKHKQYSMKITRHTGKIEIFPFSPNLAPCLGWFLKSQKAIIKFYLNNGRGCWY